MKKKSLFLGILMLSAVVLVSCGGEQGQTTNGGEKSEEVYDIEAESFDGKEHVLRFTPENCSGESPRTVNMKIVSEGIFGDYRLWIGGTEIFLNYDGSFEYHGYLIPNDNLCLKMLVDNVQKEDEIKLQITMNGKSHTVRERVISNDVYIFERSLSLDKWEMETDQPNTPS